MMELFRIYEEGGKYYDYINFNLITYRTYCKFNNNSWTHINYRLDFHNPTCN